MDAELPRVLANFFLGYSSEHTSNVALILTLETSIGQGQDVPSELLIETHFVVTFRLFGSFLFRCTWLLILLIYVFPVKLFCLP